MITFDMVRTSLEQMKYSTTTRTVDSVEELQLIQSMLSSPGFPPIEQAHEYALQHILTSKIIEQLSHHRSVFDLALASANETFEKAIQSIRIDTRIQSKELLCWSILYYFYVRVDLDFTVASLCKRYCVNERTMRRYKTSGIHRLVHLLAADEWKLRNRTFASKTVRHPNAIIY